MKMIFKNISKLAIIAALSLNPINSLAESSVQTKTDEAEISDMDREIATPKVASNLNDAIKKYMKNEAKVLGAQIEKATGKSIKDSGIKFETLRHDEVVVVTIPTDLLFFPNDTLMLPKAPQILKQFTVFANNPDDYKIILTIHTDDTGNEEYQESLAESRIITLYNWFEDEASTDMIIGYPIGAAEPIKPNNSRLNRAANRRLEIYLIPNKGLINKAKAKKLH